MYPALHTDSVACDDAPVFDSVATTRRHKVLIAGVAVASAGVLAVTPVAAAPAIEDSRKAAVELSAFTNPLATLQSTFVNTTTNLTALNTNATTSANAVAAALSNPAVQAQFTNILTAATDPQRLLGTLSALPGYVNRLNAANAGSTAQFQEAITALPGVLQISAGFLAQGKFLEALAEVNLWFLTAGLSDLRGASLDALRVPGDILDWLGLEPLARILGTSWMDTGTAGPGFGRGLLSRGIVGNFGRAVLGPSVTAAFQTAEIMDNIRGALQTGDFETALSELVNAPIKIVNAFVNGYVPEFVTDPDSPIPPGPGQSFPGLIGPTGTLDFLFRQIPAEIAAALQVPRPAPTAATSAPEAASILADAPSPSDIPSDDATLLTLDVAPSTPAVDPAPASAPAAAPNLETDVTTESSKESSTVPSSSNAPATSRLSNEDDDDDDASGGSSSTGGSSTGGSTTGGGSTGGSTTGGGSTGGSTTGGGSTTAGDSGGESGGGSTGGESGGESGGGD